MLSVVYKSVVVTAGLVLILCGFYPLFVFCVGQVLFPKQSNGSLIRKGDQIVGSALIGQNFSRPEYFHGRPSSAGERGYDAANSAGSNIGPTSKKLEEAVVLRVKALREANPEIKNGEVPVDLVTASASGLDPHVSWEGARVQIARVAAARKVSREEILRLAKKNLSGPQLGILGEPVVNILNLNLDLDVQAPLGRNRLKE